MGQLTNNFTVEEFACPCCGVSRIDFGFVVQLQMARNIANIPFHINSGYRCTKHNAEVSKVELSEHTEGMAADISAPDDHTRSIILAALVKAGFTRLGVAKDFIHVGMSPSKPQQVCWLY